MEPDEQRMRKAAHLMVSSLAGSLALVTCKDPLRVSLMQQMRNMLQSNVDPSTLEQTVQVRLGSWLGTPSWLRLTCLCFHPPYPKLTAGLLVWVLSPALGQLPDAVLHFGFQSAPAPGTMSSACVPLMLS